MDYNIRKAIPKDTDSIKQLFIEMLKSIYHTESVVGYGEGYLDKFFGNNSNLIYVAEFESKVIAYLSVEVHLGHCKFVYLDDLCVTEKYRCHGIGTALIETAEQYARDINISQIMLHVEKSNTSACRLYEKLGYVLLRNDEHDRHSRMAMRKRL